MKRLQQLLRDLIECAKPGLSSMVIITFFIGVVIALPIETKLFFHLLLSSLGVVLLVAGANISNCWMERDVDVYMERTKKRPLVTGSLKNSEAFLGAALCSAAGLALLYKFSNMLTLVLGFLALFSYVLLYTPLKRRSTISLFVGAIPGALPPVMGWTAVRGEISITPILLFWILFLWQLPHFISIAIYRRDEYAKAGLKTLPVQAGIPLAKWHMFLYSALLVIVSFLPYFLKLAGLMYMSASLLMGIAFIWFCFESLLEGPHSNPLKLSPTRKVFFASLVYLPLTIGVWAVEVLLRSFL
ncbi:MAG: heme o synthase [Bdellovibrionota bacterium]